MSPFAVALVFLFLFMIVLIAVRVGMGLVEKARKQKVAGMLGSVSPEATVERAAVLEQAPAGEESPLQKALADVPIVRTIQSHIDQGGLPWKAPGLVFGMFVMGAVGVVLGLFVVHTVVLRESAAAALGALFFFIPYLFVMSKRRKRFREFENQFPEALDFLARSLRAGHAFSVSLEMMADESPEPLGIEFRRLFNEQNLGLPLDVAMRNLAARIPLVDVRFFVSAVLLQRETGGNLAEILTKLAHVIRERFRLKGQIRAASAHGRMTMGVLTAVPIITVFILGMMSPGYYDRMINDRHGRYMIIEAAVAQTIGFLLMRKIVNIKV